MLQLTPEIITDMLKLRKIAELYPDFPNNFIPPAFTDPNYVPPFKATGTALVVTAIIFTVLLLVVVPFRLMVRVKYRSTAWGVDDLLIIPATIFTIAINVLGIVQAYEGTVGYHAYDVAYGKLKDAYVWQFVHMHLYVWICFFTKASILAFYLRIWPKGHGQTFLKGFIWFLLAVNIVSICLVMFNYRPIRCSWDLTCLLEPHEGTNFHKKLFGQSVFYAVIDFIIWAMPIPVVWRLRTSLKKRLALIALFSLGFLACAANVVRTALTWHALNTYDGTWYETDIALCNQIEVGLAIAIASLPAINAVSHAILSKLWDNISRQVRSAYSYMSYASRSKSMGTGASSTNTSSSKSTKVSKDVKEVKELTKDSTAVETVDTAVSDSPQMYAGKLGFTNEKEIDEYDRDLEAFNATVSQDNSFRPAPLRPKPAAERNSEDDFDGDLEAGNRPSMEKKKPSWPMRILPKRLQGNGNNNEGSQMRNVLQFTTRADSPVEETFAGAEESQARRSYEADERSARNVFMFTTRAESPILEDNPDFGSAALGIRHFGSPLPTGGNAPSTTAVGRPPLSASGIPSHQASVPALSTIANTSRPSEPGSESPSSDASSILSLHIEGPAVGRYSGIAPK